MSTTQREFRKFDCKELPGPEEQDYFDERGYLYVSNFYDPAEIRALQREIYDLVALIISKNDLAVIQKPFSPENFDSGLDYLLSQRRDLVATLYDVVKKLPNYIRLAAHPKHDAYCKMLLKTNLIGFASRGYGIRMDNPREHEFSTQLHQDYVSQLSSQNAIVIWSPLRDVSSELGPMKFYPGTHKKGIVPITKVGNGSQGLVIADEEGLRKTLPPVLMPTAAVGDCIFMHFLLLHESGRNIGDATRWSMISRYFDFEHESGKAINWKGGLQEGNSFEKVHPEFVL